MPAMRRIAITLGSWLGAWLLAGGTAAAESNHCELTATGDSSLAIKADAPGGQQGKLTASTDYWLSDAQLRAALGALEGIGAKLGKDDKQRKVDEAMKKDPRFMLLLINCLSDEGGVVFSASSGSKYADIPLKPASYAIAPGVGARPGQVTAMFHLSPGGKRESYAIKEPGKLVLTQFDRKGIAGSFAFKAEGRGKDAKHVEVTGKFAYACSGEACQK